MSKTGRQVLPLLAVLALLLFMYRRVVAGRVLAGGDLQIYFYPYWVQVVRSLREGQFPLWNPNLFAGSPLAANSQVGLFYPLNWAFWLLALVLDALRSSLPGATEGVAVARSLHISVLAHLWLAASSAWMLARRMGLGRWSAAVGGLVYAGSGFLGVHVDHLNQLQALAWLPLLFLPPIQIRREGGGLDGPRQSVCEESPGDGPPGLWLPRTLSIAAMSMIVLSGHMQMAFIGTLGVAIWYIVDVGGAWLRSVHRPQRSPGFLRALRSLLSALIPFTLAGLLAAVQLLPTLQLAGLSGRSVGLDWREAVSFSVPPWELPRALLPTYLVSPYLPEGIAYVGMLGLIAAAIGALAVLRDPSLRRSGLPWLVVAAAGVLLSLGAYNPFYLLAVRLRVPGFIHFRVPARFLALYVLGVGILAGIGTREAGRALRSATRRWGATRPWRRQIAAVCGLLLILGVGGELAAAAEALPHARATAARAYWDLRPATAHLVAGKDMAEGAGRVPPRFLSISQMLFEIGDKDEVAAIYGDRLAPDALWSYMVAAKQREILAPNLPLVFDVPAVDGYDGGLLPLRQFSVFSELLIPGGTLDGRLRENLEAVPDGKWLDLLGVGYVLTDKTSDLWVGDILYDRQFQPVLTGGESFDIGWLPTDFDANAVGLLYSGGPLQISLRLADGRVLTRGLPAKALDDQGEPAFETTWVSWSGATSVRGLSLRSGPEPSHLVAASLVDQRVGAFHSLALSDQFRLAHSGDVKIYEAVTAPSRAIILHDCQSTMSSASALQAMLAPAYEPAETLLLESDTGPHAACIGDAPTPAASDNERASVVGYAANEVVIDATLDVPGYVILKDAWYPGWRVRVHDLDAQDGKPRTLRPQRADLLFRAVPLEAGSWRVTFRYVPDSLYVGLALTVLGLGVLIVYAHWIRQRRLEGVLR